MSWSYKIILIYAVFITGILGMVYVASQQTNEMQEDNYYAKELLYQNVIDGKNNLNALGKPLTIKNISNHVSILIPIGATDNIQDGIIYFLKPSDQSKDLKIPMAIDDNGVQLIPNAKLATGLYTIKISWKSNGKAYFSEQNFNVQK